jgi:hypothetical protein
VANTHEAARYHVQEKSPQEFVDLERHHFHAVVVGAVLPAELDVTVVVFDEPMVRQGDAVGVSPEVIEHLLRLDDPGIALGQRVHGVRQREDDVKVRNGRQIGAAGGEPPFLGLRLTLGTMAVATGVVGDSHGAASVTRLPMPTQEGSAAGRDRPKRHVLELREAVRLTIPVAMGPHDVRKPL